MLLKTCAAIAAATLLLSVPATASPLSSFRSSQARQQAEQAADQAVADARAEVAAEARAQAAPRGVAGELRIATISDVEEGSPVRDPEGGLVGTVESVDEEGAIVSTGRTRARLPFSSFGRNDRGLVISLTRAELEAAVAARIPS